MLSCIVCKLICLSFLSKRFISNLHASHSLFHGIGEGSSTDVIKGKRIHLTSEVLRSYTNYHLLKQITIHIVSSSHAHSSDCLKLVRIPLTVFLRRHFKNYLFLSTHLLPLINVMLDFI